MTNKKYFVFKIIMTIVFALAIAAGYAYIIAKGDVKYNLLAFGCVCACFILSLIFIKKSYRSIYVTIALLLNVVADFFLVVNYIEYEYVTLIGLSIFCGVQFAYLLYSLVLCKGIGLKVTNLAFRVFLCLLAYMLIPKYIVLTTIQMIAVMYFINAFVTLLVLAIRIKTHWLMFIGFLLFFAASFFVGLMNGGAELLNIPLDFMQFFINHNLSLAFLLYIPGVFLIAASSVWEK